MVMKISVIGTIASVSGVIDEHADFTPLVSLSSPLTIDFSGVERVNSIGLRSWMRFMTQWADKPLSYSHCPVVISDQLAVIPALRGIKSQVAVILSAHIPYDCANCQHQEDFFVERKDVVPMTASAVLNRTCPSCGSAMDLINGDQLDIFRP